MSIMFERPKTKVHVRPAIERIEFRIILNPCLKLTVIELEDWRQR